jgi:hypothetical protein
MNIKKYNYMKSFIKVFVISAFLSAAPLFLSAQYLPTHPNGGNEPSPTNTPVGGGAPIDGGLSVLLLLGAAYGTKKIFKQQK